LLPVEADHRLRAIWRGKDMRAIGSAVVSHMEKLTRLIGFGATTAWLLLAGLTGGSGVLERNSIGINIAVAVLFLIVALLVLWRAIAVETARRSMPTSKAIRSLLRVEAVTGAAVMLLGMALLIAAGSRVFREGMPVFG